MPLLDHFRPPIDPRVGWESFHHRWANAVADYLDQILPRQFFARVEAHLRNEVATVVTEEELGAPPKGNGAAGAAIEVRSADPAARLLAVIEFVTPANKKDPGARRAFVAKSTAYLRHGIDLVIVDPVTEGDFHLHNDLVRELGGNDSSALAGAPPIYAAAYQPEATAGGPGVEVWFHELDVGAALPVLPLYIRGYGLVALDLEATYTETRRRARF